MSYHTRKAVVFSLLLALELCIVVFMFYSSEPKYIDNISTKKSIDRFDMVVVKEYDWSNITEIETLIVLQVDTASHTAVAKRMDGFAHSDRFYTLNLKTKNFRLVGQGTFYHKVNEYVGFNLMFITNVCLMIVLVALGVSTFNALSKIL